MLSNYCQFCLQPLPPTGISIVQQHFTNQQQQQQQQDGESPPQVEITNVIDEKNQQNEEVAKKAVNSIFEGQSFPFRLWYLINNENYRDVILWSPDGAYVLFPNEEEFVAKILVNPDEKVFKTTSMKSFVRQLNLYGFHKVQLEKERNLSFLRHNKKNWPKSVFAHVYFKRGRQDLLEFVRRRCKVKQLKAESKKKKEQEINKSSIQDVEDEKEEENNNGGYPQDVDDEGSINRKLFFQCPQPFLSSSSTVGATVSAEEIMMNFPNLIPQPENLTINETKGTKRKLQFPEEKKEELKAGPPGHTHFQYPFSFPVPSQFFFYPQTYINNCPNMTSASTGWTMPPTPSLTNGSVHSSPSNTSKPQKQVNSSSTASTGSATKVKSDKGNKPLETKSTPPRYPSQRLKENNIKINVSPLASFCATLFRPNGGRMLENCEDPE